MPPKKNNRFAKNWAPPEKEWFHPEMTPEQREKHRRDFEQEGGEFSLAKALSIILIKRTFGFSRKDKATPFVMEKVDEIWVDGFENAKEKYDPSHNTIFKTFLYDVLEKRAWKVRRRFFSHMPPKISLNIATIRHLGISYGIPGYSTDENGQAVPWYTRFVFDFQSCDFSFLPCGLKLSDKLEMAIDDLEEKDQPCADPSDRKREQEYREFYDAVARISDEEFLEHGRNHLPNSYRKLTDKALRKKLSRLDVRIVEMLIDDEPAHQNEIQQKLGISKYFYNARIEAVVRRLQLPFESIQRRTEETKRRQKRLRNSEAITAITMEKTLVFSPPQPVKVTRIVDGKPCVKRDMREFKGCPFVENEEILRWHDDSNDDPEDFVGTPSEPVKEVPEDALPYVIDDFGHWELIDDSWFE